MIQTVRLWTSDLALKSGWAMDMERKNDDETAEPFEFQKHQSQQGQFPVLKGPDV